MGDNAWLSLIIHAHDVPNSRIGDREPHRLRRFSASLFQLRAVVTNIETNLQFISGEATAMRCTSDAPPCSNSFATSDEVAPEVTTSSIRRCGFAGRRPPRSTNCPLTSSRRLRPGSPARDLPPTLRRGRDQVAPTSRATSRANRSTGEKSRRREVPAAWGTPTTTSMSLQTLPSRRLASPARNRAERSSGRYFARRTI